jgi:hypothetical protein
MLSVSGRDEQEIKEIISSENAYEKEEKAHLYL